MKILRPLAIGLTLSLLLSGSALAQESRPGGNTVSGDTGLWFVPTGETLPKGKWSGGVQLVNFDRSEGFSDITDIGGMFAFGASDRIEIFGAFGMRRIDADLVPVAQNGQPQDYLINKGWSTGIGDAWVGAKFNITSQSASPDRYATALRVMAKLPTASDDDGLGTGKFDFQVDLIGSHEYSEKVELTAAAGIKFRGQPDGYNLTKGFVWGIGAAYPSRSKLRVIGEMKGEALFDQAQTFTGSNPAPGMPREWDPDATRDLFGGFQYNATSGFYFGAGLSYTASYFLHRHDFTTSEDSDFDRLGLQVRLGYYPGVKTFAPPPATVTPTAPPTPAVPPNRAPTVKARCEPCTVEINRQLTASADAQDPDGDTLRYRWTSPTGAFGNANDRQTPWTAPGQVGAVPLTVTVDDGKGLTASDTVTVQVIAPAAKRQITFEDVHFDFDRYTLRPEATRILDEAIKAMQDDPNLRFTVEGHTCNIGTTEYNLALGERRSTAVRDYLVGRGINANRLQTVSYGEERPKHDNGREETRRLNRRAALTIRLQ